MKEHESTEHTAPLTHSIVNSARGLYRWERDEGWEKDEHQHLVEFEEGDAVCIDPFSDRLRNAPNYWPIYCTFLEYVTEDIAKVYVPPDADDTKDRTWFNEGEGEYLIHEGYLTPQ